LFRNHDGSLAVRVLRETEVMGTEVAEDRSFEEFFRSEHARLFGALCLVTGDRHEAEEIMQDAFLRLWERWGRVSGLDDPSAYLFRTAMNVFRNRYRRAALAMRRTVNLAPTEDALRTVEDRDIVVRALRDLAPNQRAAVVLTGYVGLTSEEAGRALGMRASTVRTITSRARAEIRGKAGELR
jgi:RNA polymerase sigma-70 factor (ECF subfamily)